MTPETREALLAEVPKIAWWHQIELGDGFVTPGVKPTLLETPLWKLPDLALKGKTVLDIGAWDGFYSFYAERRGAKSVLAVDYPAWTDENYMFCGATAAPGTPPYVPKAGFLLARELLESKVQDKLCALENLDPKVHGTYDTVMFYGVFYHLQNPYLGLQQAAAMSKEWLLVESHVNNLHLPDNVPGAVFYPNGEHRGDLSTYWGANPACIVGMLKNLGFKTVDWHYTENPTDASHEHRRNSTRAIFFARR